MKQWISAIFILLIFFEHARAYFDPGAGSLMLQFTLAIIVGAIFMARRKIMSILRGILSKRSS